MKYKWLEYWKKSLKDSLIRDVEIEKCEYFESENYDFQDSINSKLSEANKLIDFEEKRINKKEGITNKNSSEWIILEQIQILISPFKLHPRINTSAYLNNQKPLFPYWFVAILNRKGELSVPDEIYPIIPRKFLDPLADEKYEYIFSSVDKVDEKVTLGTNQYNSFSEYTDYLKNVFFEITDEKIENYKVNNFQTVYNSIFLLPEEDINAAISIIKLYEKLLLKNDLPKLISKFIELENKNENKPLIVSEFITHNNLHLGQMGFEFPISISQRKSLLTYLSKENEVFAINGPPGTGKTTLLQTIVANEIVKTAIKGEDPSIILACSSNNQAVTNILDCFSKSNTGDGNLKGRWLPDIEGYATYLPASGKTESELRGLNYKKLNGDGLFVKLENIDYLIKAKVFFLGKMTIYSGNIENDLNLSIEILRNDIIEIENVLKKSKELWCKYLVLESKYLKEFKKTDQDKLFYSKKNLLNIDILEENLKELMFLETNVLSCFQNETFFQKVFCFLGIKSFLNNRLAAIRIIFRDSDIEISEINNYSKHELLSLVDKKIQIIKETISIISEWEKFKLGNNLNGDPPKDEIKYWEKEKQKINNEPNLFYDELDVILRHKAFQLSLHYWEARWILESEKSLLGNNNKGEKSTKGKWKRHAMLTPCFVSTFYMAPKFFSYSMHLGKSMEGISIWDNGPLYEFIDILIVEEAGQVPPEIGVASFSLAKKAIIIGDVNQIEPIWNVSNKIDIGNLKKIGLIEDYNDLVYEELYDPKGFLSSTGSIMKMAQNSCDYKEKDIPEKGVMLAEHRRCFDEIINYCNVLAYHGKLIPLKGKANPSNIFPPMICYHVESKSSQQNGSRFNNLEADSIANWLVSNKTKIENEYGKIEESVGIITPFLSQKKTIRTALKSKNIDVNKMKIGTVHALQGAERPIIIFSMVYGDGDVSTMFFDRENKPNMLNVAVSRAKDSFVVFANTKIFDKNAKTPSGILANYLDFQN